MLTRTRLFQRTAKSAVSAVQANYCGILNRHFGSKIFASAAEVSIEFESISPTLDQF